MECPRGEACWVLAGPALHQACTCVVSCHPHEVGMWSSWVTHRACGGGSLLPRSHSPPAGWEAHLGGGQLTLGGGLELQGAPTSVGDSLPRAQGGQRKPGWWCSQPRGL